MDPKESNINKFNCREHNWYNFQNKDSSNKIKFWKTYSKEAVTLYYYPLPIIDRSHLYYLTVVIFKLSGQQQLLFLKYLAATTF